MKRFIALAVAVAMLILPVSSFALKEGVINSHKALNVYHIAQDDGSEYTEFVMLNDKLRVDARVKYRTEMGYWPLKVVALKAPDDSYIIFYQFGFFGMIPIANMTLDELSEIIPSIKRLPSSIKPNYILTFAGYEDIWAYFDLDKSDVELVKKSIAAEQMRDALNEEIR